MSDDFKIIPGYEFYGVDYVGNVKSFERNIILSTYLLNGYLVVDTYRGSLTTTLPVHRAVALAWVNNPNPLHFTIVNHKDGNALNNYYCNLEWTNYIGNNNHAINNGLRNDNISCKVREFQTGNVFHFNSMSQAAIFMGLPKDAPIERLYPKMFGKLISGQYEFRFLNDPTPWFYESRTEMIQPSRYMVNVSNNDGTVNEVYSNRKLIKDYNLYKAPNKSIDGLVSFANEIYNDKTFSYRDSYSENRFRITRQTKESKAVEITARKNNECLSFNSLTKCAYHFNVDRSTIFNRLNNNKTLNGWIFTTIAS